MSLGPALSPRSALPEALACAYVSDDEGVIRGFFAAYSNRDVDATLGLVADDVEFWPKIQMLLMGREEPYRGHDGIRDYFKDLDSTFEHVELEIQSVRAVAGGAFVFYASRGKPVGRDPYEVPVTLTVRLRDGLVVYARSVATLEELDGD